MESRSRSLPSNSWKCHDNKFSHTAALAQAMFHELNLSSICGHLSSLRNDVPCKISDRFTNGSKNLVIEAVFNDGVVWIARIRLSRELSANEVASMESEIYVMRTIRVRTKVPVPEVYAWGSGTDNVFRAPFILMEGVPGRNFCNDPSFGAIKYKVLDQMASIMVQLSLIRFPAIGSFRSNGELAPIVMNGKPTGPFTDAGDYYLHFVKSFEHRIEEATNENERNQMLSTSRLYRASAIPHFIRYSGPFPLTHVDFGLHNLLIDDNGNVISVIDWSNSRASPWESFAIFPLPLSVVWTKKSKYPKAKWEQLLADQSFFIEALKKYEKQFCTDSNVSSLIASQSVIAAEAFEALIYISSQTGRWLSIVEDLISAESAK